MIDFGDQRILLLKNVSDVVDELRDSGICRTLTQTVLLGATLGYHFGVVDVSGVKRYDVRLQVLVRTPGFAEYVLALMLGAKKRESGDISATDLKLQNNIENLTAITNSGLLHLAARKRETGLSLAILIPELMIQASQIRDELDISRIDLPA